MNTNPTPPLADTAPQNAVPVHVAADAIALKRTTLEGAKRHINHGMRIFWESLGVDLVIGKSEGVYLWDLEGRRYLDVLNDGSTYNLGHRNPQLLRIMRDVSSRVDIGCQFLASVERTQLAEKLVRHSPARLQRVHFAASGSEAADAAIRMARFATRRMRVVSIDNSYHGSFGLAELASGNSLGGVSVARRSKKDWTRVPYNDINAMQKELRKGDVAAVIVETVSANIGWIAPDEDYFQRLRALCDGHGAMLIVDEVQAGLGRGGHLWAIDRWGVEPDLLVMAKGAGGGIYPLGYTLMSERAAAWCSEAPLSMASTFGGSEIGCAIGSAVIDIVSDATFLEGVRKKADYLRDRLCELARAHPHAIVETHRFGLGVGIRFRHRRGGELMTSALYREGVLALFAPLDRSVIQLKPPLTIENAQIDDLVAALDRAVSATFRKPNLLARKRTGEDLPVAEL